MAEFYSAEKHMNMIFDGCLKYLNDTLQKEKGIRLNVKFKMDIQEQRISASVKKECEGEYLVKVSMASYNIVEDYYSKMICLEGIYEMVTLKKVFDEEIAKKYLSILIDMTLRTIIFHELGHVFNGHIDYIEAKIEEYKKLNTSENQINYIAEYLEKSKKARPYLEPIDWQALEWNADDFAISRLIGQYTYKDKIDGEILKSIDHAFFIIMFAVSSMYCLMDMNITKEKDGLEEYKLEEHLPKRFRLQKYIDSGVLATEKFNNIKLFKNSEERCICDLIVKRFEEWYILYTQNANGILNQGVHARNRRIENNTDELDDMHIDYYHKVDEYYMEILPEELKDFTYFIVYL